MLKGRLGKGGSQLVANCNQLKIVAEDGKQRISPEKGKYWRNVNHASPELLVTCEGFPPGKIGYPRWGIVHNQKELLRQHLNLS